MQNDNLLRVNSGRESRTRAVGQYFKGTPVSVGTNRERVEGLIKLGSPVEKLTSQILSFLNRKIQGGLDYMISEGSASCQMLLHIKTVLIVLLDQFHLDTLAVSQEP